jgi:hypothetical protein
LFFSSSTQKYIHKSIIMLTDIKKIPSYSVPGQVPGRRRNPKLKDRESDTLSGLLNRSRAAIGEYEAVVKWWLASESRRNLEKSHLHCHFVHHDTYMK